MTTMPKSLDTLMSRSKAIAGWSNADTEHHGLYWREMTLYRHKDGRYFTRAYGGAAMGSPSVDPRWLSESEAEDFIRDHCFHPVTGYGYTDAEIADLMAGGDPRGTSDRIVTRPDIF